MQTPRLYRIILPVTDIERAATFDGSVLGNSGRRISPGRHYFDCAGTILGCYDPAADGDGEQHGWRFHPFQYLYFAIPDLDDVLSRVRAAGGTIEHGIETMPWGERMFHARDPFGGLISFVDENTLIMKICAVQHRPVAGNLAANLARHLEFIELAGAQSADFVFFPELSLTGYEPSLAKSLATDKTDPRLDPFQQRSDASNMIIGVGLPLSAGSAVKIGMVWFTPRGPRREYAKQQLHDDELPFFVPGDGQLLLKAAGHTLAPAICYESLQAKHAENAASLGANIYLASVAKSASGMARAVRHYPEIAREHNLHVIMADCVGPSDNFVSVGRSAVWNNRGELLAQMDGESEGLVILDTAGGQANSVVGP